MFGTPLVELSQTSYLKRYLKRYLKLVVLNHYGCLNLRITVFSLARGGGYLHLYNALITLQHNISIIT